MSKVISVSVVAAVLLGALAFDNVQWAQENVAEALSLDGIVVDDFERYTDDNGDRISQTWVDGSANGSGALVGNPDPPLAERTIVHGGKQAMPLRYDNTKSPFYSEVEREYAPVQDWTVGGADTLSLWIRGDVVSFAETSPGTFTLSAVGEDVWSNNDHFRFAYRRLTGNGSIVARIDSFTKVDIHTKVGVMIRENLSLGSAHAFMVAKGEGTVGFENRPTNGTGYCKRAFGWPRGGRSAIWVKLERQGNQFTGYYSTDGIDWIKQPVNTNKQLENGPNPQTINMPESVYIGLGVCSHDTNRVCTATFSRVATTGAVVGRWQVADVGADHPGNTPDDLYVIIKDDAGKAILVTNPDPTAVNAMAWTQWRIPLSALPGVDLTRVKKIYIGVGSRRAPIHNGVGRICIDDIRVFKAGS